MEEYRRTEVYLPVNPSCSTLLPLKPVDTCLVRGLTRTHAHCRAFELEPSIVREKTHSVTNSHYQRINKMYYKLILCVCTTALFTGWVFTYGEDLCSDTVTRHSCNWTCMLLTLQWPGSFCISLSNKSVCKIPQTIQNWTIHGLWPEHTGHCCDCWRIFHSHLQEIEPELSQLWPSLVKAKNYFLFWKEEWIKHGTCAGCDEAMGSPLHYFRSAIKLRKLYDIDSVLKNSGIVTSCDVSYKYDDICGVLDQLMGRNYDLQCVTDKKGREVWIQLKINLFRNQTLGCHKKHLQMQMFNSTVWLQNPGHPCPKTETIFYFPINYEQPHDPCNYGEL